jgi:hypothetical protein
MVSAIQQKIGLTEVAIVLGISPWPHAIAAQLYLALHHTCQRYFKHSLASIVPDHARVGVQIIRTALACAPSEAAFEPSCRTAARYSRISLT